MSRIMQKEIKSEIEKLNENIEILITQKSDTMSKIPEVFLKSLEDITIQNENEVASKIALELNSNNISTFTYLINEETNEIYMNDSWIYVLGLNYKKYVRKINKILNE